MSERDLIQKLLDAVSTGDDEATEVAARACAGQPALLPALRPLLADEDPDRRWWATRTLALLETPEAGPLLVDRLSDPDESVRCAAAYALGSLHVDASIPALVARLADSSGWVRDSSADALAMLGDAAVPALVETMEDPRGGVRVRAASALRRIALVGERPGVDLDIRSPRGRAIGALFKALQDPNYLVHEHAYEALDHLGLLDNVIVM